MLRNIFTQSFSKNLLKSGAFMFSKAPMTVSITGGAGQIGYATIFRVASGEMLGKDQPVNLNLIDLPFAAKTLQGVQAELYDCSFPLLRKVLCTSSLSEGFKNTDVAMLIGAAPRGPGMERADLLQLNGKIFIDQGKALNDHASRTARVVVVGNPANTNCMIAQSHAPDLPKGAFTGMTRLDHNRSIAQLVLKLGGVCGDIQQMAVWGNHSPTMYPDLTNCTFQGKSVINLTKEQWRNEKFIPKVQQRGAEIIKLRGLSSAVSAGNAAMDHIKDWVYGTDGRWTSMAVMSSGQYGVPKGLCFSYPVICSNGWYKVVKGLSFNESGYKKMKRTIEELINERTMVQDLLN